MSHRASGRRWNDGLRVRDERSELEEAVQAGDSPVTL